MLTENEVLRQRYQAREKARRDALWVERDHQRRLEEAQARVETAQGQAETAQAQAETAQAQAETAQAQAEAAQARLKCEIIGRIHLCQRLLNQSSSPMQELEGLGLGDLEALATQLESRLPG